MPKPHEESKVSGPEHSDFLRVLRDHNPFGHPASGPIPNEHKGPYYPSKAEVLEGIKNVAEATRSMAQERANIVKEQMDVFFKNKEHK